jgi:3-hydroxyacyl-CoA dehydrogenase
VPEIADDVVGVDTAMKLGYNWKFGPFELIDKIGAAKLAERLAAEGRPVPALLTLARSQFLPRGKWQTAVSWTGWRLSRCRQARRCLVARGHQALLAAADQERFGRTLGYRRRWWPEFTGKMNALDGDVMALIGKAIPLVQEKYKALVVYNEGSNFSAGANLGLPCSRSTSRHGAKSKSSSRVARRPTRRLNMRRSRW